MRLGEVLLKVGKITQAQLDEALAKQGIRKEEHIGELLVQLGFISYKDLARALSMQAGVEYIELQNYTIDPAALKLIPKYIAAKKKLLPLTIKNGNMKLAMVNPLDIVAIDEVQSRTNMHVDVVVVAEDELTKIIDKLYTKDAVGETKDVKKSIETVQTGVITKDIKKLDDAKSIMRTDGRVILPPAKNKIGEMLHATGKITEAQLNKALVQQKVGKDHIGEILVQLGFVSYKDLAHVLSMQAGVEHIELQNYKFDPAALKLIPKHIIIKNKILPLSVKDGILKIAVANPFDVVAIDEVMSATKMQVGMVVAAKDELVKTLEELYKGEQTDTVESIIQQAETPSVVESVDRIITKAIKSDATDIHIEPEEKRIRVRLRIDGILHEFVQLPKEVQSAITTRIKIMANLDISETRIPQDGRADFICDNKKVDIRVSSFPCVFGEHMVMRLLDRTKAILGLEKLGLSDFNLELLNQAIGKSHGIILVTGPTGSGKTTTLYSAILRMNSSEENIITIEDPVEYIFPSIRQSQINPRAGLTFASGLRAMLRQDPDVIFVGEVRDTETMEMMIRAALTGHLVFSTLHTNDAAGAIARLLDMGAEPFLIASTLLVVLSQRLVRRICKNCEEPYVPSETLLSAVGWKERKAILFKGKGCYLCNNTGYKGRIGIYELLTTSPAINKLIMERKASSTIKEAATQEGMKTMLEDGLEKVERGITTLEEILRTVYM